MLTNLSAQLNASPQKRHLLFLAAAISTLLLIGYNFGTFDEAMHIPFLKASANPGLYDGDTLIGLHSIYYSYFWFFFIPFLQRGWLEPALFITHLASIYLKLLGHLGFMRHAFPSPAGFAAWRAGLYCASLGFCGFPGV